MFLLDLDDVLWIFYTIFYQLPGYYKPQLTCSIEDLFILLPNLLFYSRRNSDLPFGISSIWIVRIELFD